MGCIQSFGTIKIKNSDKEKDDNDHLEIRRIISAFSSIRKIEDSDTSSNLSSLINSQVYIIELEKDSKIDENKI